jgi:hypothetical protein
MEEPETAALGPMAVYVAVGDIYPRLVVIEEVEPTTAGGVYIAKDVENEGPAGHPRTYRGQSLRLCLPS